MQISRNDSTFNYILLRKNGDKLFETRNSEKLPFITLNAKTINSDMLTQNHFNKPFISAIEEGTSFTHKKIDTNIINNTSSFPYRKNLKNNRVKNFAMEYNKNESSKKVMNNDKNNNISSSSFNDKYPGFNKNIFGTKSHFKSSIFSLISDNKSGSTNKKTSTVDDIFSKDSSFILKSNKSLKKRKINFMNNINKNLLLDQYLLTRKSENLHGSFSKAERKILINNQSFSDEEKKYPFLYKDICTEKLILKDKEMKNNKLKLIPYILSERYKHSKLGSSLDKLNTTKTINIKGNFKTKRNNNFHFKGGQTRNIFLLEFINQKLNSCKNVNNYDYY